MAFAQATAAYAPTSLSFSPSLVGGFGGYTAIIATATGSTPLVLQSLTLSGANTGDFTIDTYGCPQSIPQGGTCYINVLFRPAGLGPRSATLMIVDDTGSAPVTVPLTGIGQAVGTIQFSPSTLDFGNQGIRVPSAPRVLTLTNPGSTRVHLDLPFTFAGDFQKVNDTCKCWLDQQHS